MVKIDEYLAKNHSQAKLVLQIHDELLFEVPDAEMKGLVPALSSIMTGCVKLPVKLTVEAGIGKTWFDAKD
jgi:DNA polymerase-1